MNPRTIVSAKGQVVLPHAVRSKLGWGPGKGLEVVMHADAVTLRSVPSRPKLAAQAVFDMLSRIGPTATDRLSDEDMDWLIAAEAARRYPPQ